MLPESHDRQSGRDRRPRYSRLQRDGFAYDCSLLHSRQEFIARPGAVCEAQHTVPHGLAACCGAAMALAFHVADWVLGVLWAEAKWNEHE